MRPSGTDRFFAYARERHAITLRRAAGMPRVQWTDDPILQKYRFTCVFRELDRTTTWFRQYVRDPLRALPEVLLATVVFRMLNRVEVGEAIFCQTTLERGIHGSIFSERELPCAFDLFLRDGDTRHLRRAVRQYVGPRGPYVTGAYIISTPPGYTKLDGVLQVIKGAAPWRADAEAILRGNMKKIFTLRQAWRWLREFPYLGNFHSYEIVTDLRHTALLDRAPDIMTWANVGPGARRGMNRVRGRDLRARQPDEDVVAEMRELLALSQDHKYWPRCGFDFDKGWDTGHPRSTKGEWPTWELRDVEHTLCEFDKYERVRLGEGRPRGVFR